MKDVILYFACKYFGDWERIYDALEKQEEIDFQEIDILKEKYKDMYITVLDLEYPIDLKQIDRPPFILFYKGNFDLIKKETKLWYFGSYFNDEVSATYVKHKNQMNENKINLITGYSSDFERSLLNSSIPENSIIIRDSGINSYINMTKIEEEMFLKNNLLISEYPDKVIPSLYTWECSNRIKIGMSIGIFLISTLKEKITFKIIADTIDEKRDVFCYNKNIDEKSHNSILINKGANGIEKIEEIKNG